MVSPREAGIECRGGGGELGVSAFCWAMGGLTPGPSLPSNPLLQGEPSSEMERGGGCAPGTRALSAPTFASPTPFGGSCRFIDAPPRRRSPEGRVDGGGAFLAVSCWPLFGRTEATRGPGSPGTSGIGWWRPSFDEDLRCTVDGAAFGCAGVRGAGREGCAFGAAVPLSIWLSARPILTASPGLAGEVEFGFDGFFGAPVATRFGPAGFVVRFVLAITG